MQMCLGYLKLAALDETLKAFLVAKKQTLAAVVEAWLQGDTPIELESSRVLLKFLTRLEIPNQTLCDWLTVKFEVYQKTNDLLLQYVADNWNHPKLKVGEYLFTKAADEGVGKALIGIFLPLLETLKTRGVDYHQVLLSVIPREWARAPQDFDTAVNLVRIYAFIANHCRNQLQDQTSPQAGAFIDHLCQTASLFLQDRFSVHLKKEVLLLIGLIYNLKTSKGEFVNVRLNDSILNLQKQFFPIKSRELAKESAKGVNFNLIIEAFLSLLQLSKNLKVRSTPFLTIVGLAVALWHH
jgi:hypothetical protein